MRLDIFYAVATTLEMFFSGLCNGNYLLGTRMQSLTMDFVPRRSPRLPAGLTQTDKTSIDFTHGVTQSQSPRFQAGKQNDQPQTILEIKRDHRKHIRNLAKGVPDEIGQGRL